MVKSLFILVNFLGLMLLNFLLQKIEVQHNLPDQLSPGSSTEVELVISKGKVEGFAKLQINVDPGLTIEAIENAGASFTFNDQKAKFIWMSLPEDKDVTLRFRLIAAPDAAGPKNMDGHFSYIDDNQRLVYDIEPATVQTTEEDAVVSNDDQRSNESAAASVFRTLDAKENGRILVSLHLNKSNLGGFAKLQETISSDYTAVAVESGDAVFNIVENKVKFVWFDIPADQELTISYEMIPVVDNPETDPTFSGEFSYLVDNETQTVTVTSEETELPVVQQQEESEPEPDEEIAEVSETEPEEEDEPEVVEVEESPDWESEELSDEEKEQQRLEEEAAEEARLAEMDETETEDSVQDEPEAEESEKETEVSNVPETAISYRVQISAANKLVDEAYFASMHNYTGPFIVENHEGWIKYTTGGFDVYRFARDHRNDLNRQYNFPGPFVTAYNEGDRITVQEALMITNQKWVP